MNIRHSQMLLYIQIQSECYVNQVMPRSNDREEASVPSNRSSVIHGSSPVTASSRTNGFNCGLNVDLDHRIGLASHNSEILC